MIDDLDYLPISLVNHTVFCPRRAWLEINGEKSDTYQMQAGDLAHKRVDSPEKSRLERRFAVPIVSNLLGVVGKIDELVFSGQGVGIVEYKATPVRRKARVTKANRIQLTLQRVCLEEMGYHVDSQCVYFTDHHKRVIVDLNNDDIDESLQYVRQTRYIVESLKSPQPLIDDERCSRCSHLSVCIPDEHASSQVHRRIHPSNPDGQVLHLTIQGSRASIRSGRVEIEKEGETLGSVPLERVFGVVVHGNVDISSALNRNLLWNGVPVVWCSTTGRVYGFSKSTNGPNGLARVQQHVLSSRGCLPLASEMISAKIWNQITLLRRNARTEIPLKQLRKNSYHAQNADSIPTLFGIEGEAAAQYFSYFSSMLDGVHLEEIGWKWIGRIGRGATDPINILMNLCYGLLQTEALRAVLSCGLDPHAGFFHSSNRNKPALVLDLMEEFRAPVADSVVVSLINRHEIKGSDFLKIGGSVRLSDKGRKAVIRAFERRIQTSFKHPLFGYEVTWRRALEVQARLILGVLDGSMHKYSGVKTR